MAEPYKCTVTL